MQTGVWIPRSDFLIYFLCGAFLGLLVCGYKMHLVPKVETYKDHVKSSCENEHISNIQYDCAYMVPLRHPRIP